MICWNVEFFERRDLAVSKTHKSIEILKNALRCQEVKRSKRILIYTRLNLALCVNNSESVQRSKFVEAHNTRFDDGRQNLFISGDRVTTE
jgi:hypothetical protein